MIDLSMATFVWTLQGSSPTTIDATDKIQFAGSAFDAAIEVGSYNDSTHVESSGGANDSSGNSPHNTKFLTSSTVSLNGAGSANLNTISTANSPIKVNFSHGSAVACTEVKAYFYDGTTPATAPTGVTAKLAEQGDSSWADAEGSGAALSLADSASATSHNWYLLPSMSPDSVGTKTGKIRFELTYT